MSEFSLRCLWVAAFDSKVCSSFSGSNLAFLRQVASAKCCHLRHYASASLFCETWLRSADRLCHTCADTPENSSHPPDCLLLPLTNTR